MYGIVETSDVHSDDRTDIGKAYTHLRLLLVIERNPSNCGLLREASSLERKTLKSSDRQNLTVNMLDP